MIRPTMAWYTLLSNILAALSFFPGRAAAQAANDLPARCEALQRADFSKVPDALTQVMEAKFVAASGDAAAYCQVSGYVSPSVGFLLRLPPENWNGKFIELGCGGFCGGTAHIAGCDDPLRRGYACIVSDGGHKGGDAKWAYNNWQGKVDLLFRAGHVSALAGKAIVERYYGHMPRKSYFSGCSGGGFSALWEAQKFPWDFDGIIAGAPALSETGIDMGMLWNQRALTDESGAPILGRAELDLLHQAVLAQCDLNDGVKDGLIGDPRQCQFEPAALRCTTTRKTGCLTDRQIQAVEKVYGGPVTSKGERIFPPSPMRGSEHSWRPMFGGGNQPGSAHGYLQEVFRYFDFQPDMGPSWNVEDFDFDRDYRRLGMMETLHPDNPDLRRFKAAGGKLLSYTGWNDVGETPLRTVDYYETVEKVMGGRAATQDFFRLFVVSGMNHCTGGDGAYAIDLLSYLEDWVEKGQAPERMIGAHLDTSNSITFTRPVFPYPLVARYTGRGDPNKAENFESRMPVRTR